VRSLGMRALAARRARHLVLGRIPIETLGRAVQPRE
jgi:hypothetical protein